MTKSIICKRSVIFGGNSTIAMGFGHIGDAFYCGGTKWGRMSQKWDDVTPHVLLVVLAPHRHMLYGRIIRYYMYRYMYYYLQVLVPYYYYMLYRTTYTYSRLLPSTYYPTS